ncbi:swarming motility protein YbiA [Acrasis kona]|uniref:Swarming motility protein YbiA n=1 Tax=Acrasis kona TaxID=1008807 RepID=A0AAW2YTX2_9EUKA
MTSDILFFYSKSADKPPGRGVNEKVNDSSIYTNLTKNWRRTLSNFHTSSFEYEGKKYRTIEHCFHAKKIAIASAERALEFSLDSRSKLSRGDGDEARKNRKMITLSKTDLAKWNFIKSDALEKMQFCKFSQVADARQVLLATCDAELWHGTRGTPKIRQFTLENVRRKLRDQSMISQKTRKRKLEVIQGEDEKKMKRKRTCLAAGSLVQTLEMSNNIYK